MLFALTDFTQYLLRNGPYSPGAFVGQGAFLATSDAVSHLDGVRDGDGIFCHPLNSFVGWVVMYVTGGPWSHVGILTSEGTVLEAITRGVVERSATCYFDGRHYILIKHLHPRVTNEQRRHMISRGRSKVGIVKYDWAGVIRLGLRLIFGFNYGWQIRCSIDVVLFLCTLSFVARAIPWLRLAFILLAGIYIAIVFASKHFPQRATEAKGRSQQ
jgi:hypothetical protein